MGKVRIFGGLVLYLVKFSILKKAKVFIGLPGSGKTTFIRNNIHGYHIVDADQIKTTHPDWDQKNPQLVHDWSVREAEFEMNRLSDLGVDICMDSGGVNNRYSIRIINMLKEKGYWVEVIHMDTPLNVCLERNSKRDRKVSEDVIIEKSTRIDECVKRQKVLADSYRRIIYQQNYRNFLCDLADFSSSFLSYHC